MTSEISTLNTRLRFSADGHCQPLQPGDTLKGYVIEAARPWLDRWFYLAQDAQGPVVLAESPAYFKPLIQERVWQAASPAMQAQGLELLDWFQAAWQGIALNYAVYPRWLWEALDEVLLLSLPQGPASESELRETYHWLRQTQRLLAESGWVNPSLALPLMLKRPGGELIQLEWEYCVPIDGSLHYPRFLRGCHRALPETPAPQPSATARLARQAAEATLLARLQSKSPTLWAPQTVSWQAIRPWLSREMRDWLTRWPDLPLASDWPDLPASMFRPNAAREDYQTACLTFNRALKAHQAGDDLGALIAADQAVGYDLNDPWALWLSAVSLRRQAQPAVAARVLQAAWRIEPLACLAKEAAQLALSQPEDISGQTPGQTAGHAPWARDWLEQLLTLSPEDDEAWFCLARLAAHNGELTTAEKALRQACRLRPLNRDYHHRLQELLERLGLPTHPTAPAVTAAKLTTKLEEVSLPSEPQTYQPGQKLDIWKLETEIRSAGSHPASLWRASQAGIPVLLKLYPLQSPLGRQLWQQEATAAGKLTHPVCLRLQTATTIDDTGMLVYPWLSGENLEQQLLKTGPLTPEALGLLSHQLSAGIQALEAQGLSHGDLAPANLIWHQRQVTLVDYDNLGPADQSRAGFYAQPAYAPPERSQNGLLGSDRYSLALSLLHLASGLFPDLMRNWQTRDYAGYQRYLLHLPADWTESLLQACRWDPARRRHLALPITGTRPVPNWLCELSAAVNTLAIAKTAAEGRAAIQNLFSCERSALSLYHAAFHALRLGESEQALAYARACLQADPDQLGALWIMAELQILNGAHEQAAASLKRALSLDADAPETYQLMIRLYSAAGVFTPAWAACEQLKRCLPLTPEPELARFELLIRFDCQLQALQLGHQLLNRQLTPELRVLIQQRLKELQQQRGYAVSARR